MENNNWVDQRMAALDPAGMAPNVDVALARLESRRRRPAVAKWTLAAAGTAIAIALAFPAPRVFAQRCIDACASLLPVAPKPVATAAMPIPPVFLNDAEGHAFQLSDYRGKIVLLNFWATWCPPCVKEMPVLSEIEAEFSGRGVAVLGVSMDDGWHTVRPFLEKHKPGYRIAMGLPSAADAFDVQKLPATFLLGPHGEVLERWDGVITKEDVGQRIRAIE
ncbi:MAG: TlpA disulfide reductase family protein [Bryobacteraceae bacterium]